MVKETNVVHKNYGKPNLFQNYTAFYVEICPHRLLFLFKASAHELRYKVRARYNAIVWINLQKPMAGARRKVQSQVLTMIPGRKSSGATTESTNSMSESKVTDHPNSASAAVDQSENCAELSEWALVCIISLVLTSIALWTMLSITARKRCPRYCMFHAKKALFTQPRQQSSMSEMTRRSWKMASGLISWNVDPGNKVLLRGLLAPLPNNGQEEAN